MAWPPGGCTMGTPWLGDVAAEIGGRDDAVAQVVLVERFLQADGDGFEVASGEAAVGGIALGEDEQVLSPAAASRSSLVQRKPPMLAKPSFLADMVQPSASENISCAICFGRLVCVAGLAQLDEVGVFGEAAGVEVERNADAARQTALTGVDVGHRDRLAAAGVVGDGQHDERNALASDACDQALERGDVHVALERMRAWPGVVRFGDRQVDGLGADEFDVGARGIEVRVVGNDVARLAHDAEEDALGGAALVGGDHVAEAEDVLDGVA